MSDPARPATPGTPPAAAGPSASLQPAPGPTASPEDAAPGDEKTAPHRLRKLAVRLATQRRRSTAATLVVRRPKQAEVRVPLDRSETLIGRDPRCDIVLRESSASRKHARIRRNDGGFFEVLDLGSRNGVWVDQARVDRMTLVDGDSFVIGDTAFVIAVGTVVGVDD